MLLDYVENVNIIELMKKQDKISSYYNILFFLDEKKFLDLLNSYMDKKN